MFVQELHGADDFQDGRLLDEVYDFWNRQDKQAIWLRFGCFRLPKREDYEKIFRRSMMVLFVRDETGILIGYSEGCRCMDNERHVELGLAVDKGYRRNGVAFEMVMRMCRECSCQGIEKAEAYIMPENLTMTALVKKIMEKLPVRLKFEDGSFHALIDPTKTAVPIPS
ncbi:MAG: GNAT family N-acetyltransferase [Syntrophus sp. (in: bacteria)]